MRTRNPRVELLRHLDNMYRGLKWVREHWKAEGQGTVFDSSPDMFNNPWRKRRPDEYPEAQPEEWKQVIDEMWALEQAASAVRLFAKEQLDKTMTNRVRAEERRDV